MDARLAQARELHRQSVEYKRRAEQFRDQRNRIIRTLFAEGMAGRAIAAAIGCSPELVSHVVNGRVGPGTGGRRRPPGG